MPLGVEIIDKLTNKVLNKDDLTFCVLTDDTIKNIKTKLFAFLGLQYYPNFIKLEIYHESNDSYERLDESHALLFYYDKLPQVPKIYVSNVFSVTDQPSFNGISLETYELYTESKKEKNNIKNLFNLLHDEFTDLTMDDLLIIIKMKMVDFNERAGVISSSEVENLLAEITSHYTNITEEYQSENKKHSKEQEYLQDFCDKVYEITDYSKYYDLDEHNFPIFKYTNITFAIDQNVDGKFIKLSQIFNQLELSDEIPFIAYTNPTKREPMIKVYNKITQNLSENTIKSWVLNEKKRLNQLSYKKIKGLMIKYHVTPSNIQSGINVPDTYLTMTLNERGLIMAKVKFEEDDDQKSIEDIKLVIKYAVDNIINKLNELQGIYIKQHRLEPTDKAGMKIDSINAVLATNIFINKTNFKKMLTRHEISKFFELKETKESKDKQAEILSMYYKRNIKDLDSKGLTVNIRNNPYKLQSSLITIYAASHLNQLQVITNEIVVTSLLTALIPSTSIIDEEVESEAEQTLKEKSNIKSLRTHGVKMLSTKCQKHRQPIIDDARQMEKTRTLVYEGNRYICANDAYPYPGLTPDKILCCYKNPNKGLAQNMQNINIFETKVQPSNFIVQVTEKQKVDGKDTNQDITFDTYVIKVVSDTSSFVKSRQSSPFFYYLAYKKDENEFPLVHIHNMDLVRKIEENEQNDQGASIWLETVPLSQLITKPSKSKCPYQPNLEYNEEYDLHYPCREYAQNNVFGYNINSYPCCFDKQRPLYNVKRRKDKDPTKQHILTTDKLLSEKRQGFLPPGLHELFNDIIKTHEGTFLRWGVNQNKLSFFNCILEGIENKADDFTINNTTELKRYLVNYLNKTPIDFEKLNGGAISLKYTSIKNYTDAILDNYSIIDWSDAIDLVQRALGCNILVIDVPYVETESTKLFDYKNTKLICNLAINRDLSKPFMIFIKKRDAFEIVVQNTIVDDKVKIKFIFEYTTEHNTQSTSSTRKKNKANKKINIVNFLWDYYNDTCVKENEYPESFKYTPMYTINELKDILNDNIYFQFVTPFNKVNMIATKRGLIIPVIESGIIDDIPQVSLNEFIQKGKAITLQKTLQEIKSINKILQRSYSIIGLTKDMDGAMTNFGQIIPIHPDSTNKEKIPILNISYYPNADDYLSDKIIETNDENKYTVSIAELKDNQYQVKKQLGDILSNDEEMKSQIKQIVRDKDISRSNKINMIIAQFKKALDTHDFDVSFLKVDLTFILQTIANEVINDNIENSLLNNMVTSDVFNPTEIVKRPNESLLLNINDILKWLKKWG
jgi:hypothetical protein